MINFPMFHDYQIGLSEGPKCKGEDKFIQNLFIEQTMDDDVETDDEILKNAKGTCTNDLDHALDNLLKNDKSRLKFVINNVEIKSRCHRDHFYGRDGKYKEEFMVGFAHNHMLCEETKFLENEFKFYKEKQHKSCSKFEALKRRDFQEDLNSK